MAAPVVRSVGNRTLGGTSLGAVGAGLYAGMVLTDGDDFRALSLVNSTNPKADYFTTRGAYSGGGNTRTPASGVLNQNVYVDPYYTGILDSNRGIPIAWDSLSGVQPHVIAAGEGTGALQLLSGKQSAAENLLLNQGTNPLRVSMIATLGRISYQAPCILEARVKYPSGGPAGWHPSFWAFTTQPNQGVTGNEYGFEGNSSVFQAYMDDHTSPSTVSPNTGNLQIAGGHDSSFHLLTILMTTTYWSYLIDGVEVNRIGTGINFSGSNASTAGWTPANHGLADFFMFTCPSYNGTFLSESYTLAPWTAATAGIAATIEYWRIWLPTTGTLYYPHTLQGVNADVQVAAGGAISKTLPSQTTLWGASSLTENICGIQVDIEEPGIGNNTTGFSTTTGLPAYLSYNSGTRVLSGTAPANAGRTHIKLEVVGSGNACRPFRFNIDVAPVFVGSTSVTFINGKTASNYDLYAAWDCGRLIGAAGGTSGKGLTATSLPTGMTLNSDGTISGTPTSTAVFTVATSCTNSAGQTTSQNITMTVVASTSAVAAPTLVSGTLVGSWDFNSNNMTVVTSGITAITGSDSTSNTLANAVTSGPQIVAKQDGNGTWRNTAQFVSTLFNFLQINSDMGIAASHACTMVIIAEVTHAAGNIAGVSMSLLDIGNGANAFSASHNIMLAATSTTGFSYRKTDASSVSSSASQGSAYSTTGVHYVCGRSNAGTTATAIMNLGTAANVVGGNSNQPSGVNFTTLGASRETNAQARHSDARIYRVLVYSNAVSDADEATIQSWASTNYGTVAA